MQTEVEPDVRREMLGVKEAAERTGWNQGTIAHWASDGKLQRAELRLEPLKGGGTKARWYVEPEELLAYIEALPVQAKKMHEVRQRVHWGSTNGGRLKMTDDGPAKLANDALLTAPELAELLGLSAGRVYHMLQGDEVPGAFQTEKGRWLISRNDAEAVLEARKNEKNGKAEPEKPEASGNGSGKLRAERGRPDGGLSLAEAIDNLAVAVRELQYAYQREEKARKKRLQEQLQQVLQQS